MTEYWKSVGNYYCDYCKIFVRNDAFNRRQHEASPRHEGALKRQVRDIHRNSEKEARALQDANRELARIGGKTNLEKKPEVTLPKKINVGTRPKKAAKTDTLDDSSVYRAALAAQAIPGQWSTVEVSDNSAPLHIQVVDDDELKAKTEVGDSVDTTVPGLNTDTPEPTQYAKRRRDGADEELIKFRVQSKVEKSLPIDDLEDGGDVPLVSFKKKKTKAGAKLPVKSEPT